MKLQQNELFKIRNEKKKGNSKTPIKSANGGLSKTVQALKTGGFFLLHKNVYEIQTFLLP